MSDDVTPLQAAAWERIDSMEPEELNDLAYHARNDLSEDDHSDYNAGDIVAVLFNILAELREIRQHLTRPAPSTTSGATDYYAHLPR